MSPVTLSAPSSQAAQTTQPRRKGVRFGENPVDAPKPSSTEDKVEIRQVAETAAAEAANGDESKETKPQEAAKTPEKPGFWKSLGERLSKFFSRIGKAFQKLFAKDNPKTELDLELKQVRTNAKQGLKKLSAELQSEKLRATLKENAERIRKNGTPEEKEAHAELLKAAETKDGLDPFVEDIQTIFAAGAHLFNNPQELLKKLAELAELKEAQQAPEEQAPEPKQEPEATPAPTGRGRSFSMPSLSMPSFSIFGGGSKPAEEKPEEKK